MDLGCGTGILAFILARQNKHMKLFAIDKYE